MQNLLKVLEKELFNRARKILFNQIKKRIEANEEIHIIFKFQIKR